MHRIQKGSDALNCRQKMDALYFVSILALIGAVCCEDNTSVRVTEEAWFDVEIKDFDADGDYKGRFTVAVFGEELPITTLNFLSIVKGHKAREKLLHYKNTPIHRIVRDFVIQMGDITVGDGTGGTSIYGQKFNDEKFTLSHRSRGWLSMANHGKDTNGSQFFILLNRARWLDGKHVVFGKVIGGMDVVKTIGDVEANPDTAQPTKDITITNCGVVGINQKYDLDTAQQDSDDDL